MSTQMEELIALAKVIENNPATDALREENQQLKEENQELKQRLEKVVVAAMGDVNDAGDISDGAGEWSEVPRSRGGSRGGSKDEDYVLKQKHHHKPSNVRGTDKLHNPVASERTLDSMVDFGYKLPKMEVFPNEGYPPPKEMVVGHQWVFETGKTVPYYCEENPFFKTNMCLGVLHERRRQGKPFLVGNDDGCDMRGTVEMKSGEKTCFYCHDHRDLKPFRKFLYGQFG